MVTITVEIKEDRAITTAQFGSIEAAQDWINEKRKEKRYSLEDLERCFRHARMPTLKREAFNPIVDFYYMTFQDWNK